jgi:hypothetical protein
MRNVATGGAMIELFMIQSMCHELATSGKAKIFKQKVFKLKFAAAPGTEMRGKPCQARNSPVETLGLDPGALTAQISVRAL